MFPLPEGAVFSGICAFPEVLTTSDCLEVGLEAIGINTCKGIHTCPHSATHIDVRAMCAHVHAHTHTHTLHACSSLCTIASFGDQQVTERKKGELGSSMVGGKEQGPYTETEPVRYSSRATL